MIQKELQSRITLAYDDHIVSEKAPLLKTWIANHYPHLEEFSEDILKGVFRRLRKKLLDFDFDVMEWNTDSLLLKYGQIECNSLQATDENRSKNLGLSIGEFKALVSKLKEGDETIIEKVYLTHFESCILILKKKTNCTYEEANDSCMDALVEIRSDMMKDKILYGNLESYFTTRAIGKYYKMNRKKSIDTHALEQEIVVQDHFDMEEDFQERNLKFIVRQSIEKLCDECRYILKLLYYEDINMNEISKKMNKSHSAIRKQASRCRTKLKNYISESFYHQYATYFK